MVSERIARTVLQDMRRAVKREYRLASVASLHGGVVTVVQRFRSDHTSGEPPSTHEFL